MAQLMVVSWVPMATRMVSALAFRPVSASVRPATVATRRMGISPRIVLSFVSSPPPGLGGGKRGALQEGVRWFAG
ncbi:hypothetical protein D3C80_1938550 [compost metagenome]